jgi:hypothetical protein
LSTKDLKEKVDAVKSTTQKTVEDFSVLDEQLNEQEELKAIYLNRTNKTSILMNQSDHTLNEMQMSLFNLIETNKNISNYNSIVNI